MLFYLLFLMLLSNHVTTKYHHPIILGTTSILASEIELSFADCIRMNYQVYSMPDVVYTFLFIITYEWKFCINLHSSDNVIIFSLLRLKTTAHERKVYKIPWTVYSKNFLYSGHIIITSDITYIVFH